MDNILEDFPLTIFLFFVGLFVGSIWNPDLNSLVHYDFSGIAVNPLFFMQEYFSDFLISLIKNSFFALGMAIFFGSIGFIIDFIRREESY